jgi:hypothetical protein
MSDSISATHQYLLTHFGPLLTLSHLAEVLHRSPNGLRMALARKREPFTVALASTRRQVGRRLYFEARRVAEIIDQDREASAEAGTLSSAGIETDPVSADRRRSRPCADER